MGVRGTGWRRMKVHRVLAQGCLSILRAVFDEGRVLDRSLESHFRANPKWGKRDRALVAETVFEVVRWRRALAFVADDAEPESLCAAQWTRMGLAIPDWWSWSGCPVGEMHARELALPDQARAVRESVPDWLDATGEEELGAGWGKILSALNRRAPVFLRVNTLKNSAAEAREWLNSAGLDCEEVSGSPDALRVTGGRQIPRSLLAEGRVEIQDLGSQRIAPLLGVEPGMRVIDACAGAGGKTLQLAALMRNRGELVAMDVAAAKLREARARASRAGVQILQTELWDGGAFARRAGWADRVLIDAPCSGLGTLRRQPDLKWRLTPESLGKTRRLQRKLLDHYPSLLRAGGKFVYATCSILPSENHRQIEALAERDGRWTMEEAQTVHPGEGDADGFFAARLAGT